MIAILLLVLLLMLSFLVSCSWPFAPGSLVLAWATELPRATQVLTYNSPPEKFHPISFSFFSVSVADFSALEEGEITAEFFVWRGAKPLRNFRLPGRETTPAQPPRNFLRNFSRNVFSVLFWLVWGPKKILGKIPGEIPEGVPGPPPAKNSAVVSPLSKRKIPEWFRPPQRPHNSASKTLDKSKKNQKKILRGSSGVESKMTNSALSQEGSWHK